ncbi:hypothetical protein PMI04_015835 [Sphingobium sp. AP49]|uniref:hypothetical protein n=1 Tax=Sphingobium sp. AP49 TaxID=1144307 RepID=UPI0005606874|nr:hypothetical protein [Sphingobium sp. AP49]WHO38019.1 hypothetical protein PMI04_015835 [Sphingobium sp. AP49]
MPSRPPGLNGNGILRVTALSGGAPALRPQGVDHSLIARLGGPPSVRRILIMPRRKWRGRRRSPPGWFMPAVIAALGAAGALLSMAMLGIVE